MRPPRHGMSVLGGGADVYRFALSLNWAVFECFEGDRIDNYRVYCNGE